MTKDLRKAALWELVMSSANALQDEVPVMLTKNTGVLSLDAMLERMANASNEDYEYGYFLYTCMIAGLCYKILVDLMSEADIQKMLSESETFKNQIHAN